ncbi:hypothetical protein TrispH2_007472 [Trichoplax sp. H2]|nr:hypothetical protein TrispH2_007472 [Trichoplax sp. H2]|eukprot:RDD40587.1 hypothetical protein TrispH2_007472 [Trichoplax sp. H2]
MEFIFNNPSIQKFTNLISSCYFFNGFEENDFALLVKIFTEAEAPHKYNPWLLSHANLLELKTLDLTE